MSYQDDSFPVKKIVSLVLVALVGVFMLFSIGSLVEKVDATEVLVVQDVIDGDLHWYTTPGLKWQGWGRVTKYHKRSQYWFSAKTDQGQDVDQSIKVRFNDGGHGQVSGSIAWEMPSDDKSLNVLHTKYGSQNSVEQQLIRTIVEKSVYMTGPLMSSKESYAERRNDLIKYIEDQISNGIYQTRTDTVKEVDTMTGQPKTVNYVRLIEEGGKPGVYARQETSPLHEFNVRTFNLSLNSVTYDKEVEAQIASQQQATMQVQTAIARAKEAEQQAITAAKNGEAKAAEAKWEQEVVKAKAVTEAQQQLEVARLQKDAAEQEKLKQILLGQGEAERRRLVMSADGALQVKVDAWLESQRLWAEAIGKFQGQLVPQVVTGGGSAANGAATATSIVELLGIKAARDLSLDMSTKQK